MELFKVVFYTKDSFVKDPITYKQKEGGDIHAFNGLYTDFWSFFEAPDLLKGMNSKFIVDNVNVWWKHEESCLEKDLKPYRNHKDATQISLFAEHNSRMHGEYIHA